MMLSKFFKKAVLSAATILSFHAAFAQQILEIYNDQTYGYTGSWAGGNLTTLEETTEDNPAEGVRHFKLDYFIFNWWAGCGFSVSNWRNGPFLDVSGYDRLRLSFRGPAVGHEAYFNIISEGDNYGNTIELGYSPTYKTVEIPLSDLTDGTDLDLTRIDEFSFGMGNAPTGNGTFYFDKIEFVRDPIGAAPTISITSPTANANFSTANPVQIAAQAGDTDGNVEEVHFYVNSALYAVDKTPPFSFDYLPLKNGAFTASARAFDDDGNFTQSAPVRFTIQTTNLPAAAARRAGKMGKGVNLGNWLEAYWVIMYGGTFPEPGVYTFENLRTLKNMGVSTIRLPVLFESFFDTLPPYRLQNSRPIYRMVDSVVTWTARLNMNLIIDNHHGRELSDANFERRIPELCGLWKNIARRYQNLDPERVLFELRNEPDWSISARNLRTVQQAIIDTIRRYDGERTLIVGANYWNSGWELVKTHPYNDQNIIYTFHNYDPYEFTHQGFSWSGLPTGVPFPNNPTDVSNLKQVLSGAKNWARNNNVPVFLGEFGVSVYADSDSRCRYAELMGSTLDSLEMPWIYWGWKSADVRDEQFGWFRGGVVHPDSLVECFRTALGLEYDPTAVKEVAENQRFATIFPNPANGEFFINNLTNSSLHFRLFDSAGRQILSGNAMEKLHRVEISHLPKGLYLLELHHEAGRQMEKLILVGGR